MADQIFYLDIQKAIEDNIWKRFTRKRSIANFFRNKDDYYFDINWASIQFTHKTIKNTPRPQIHDIAPENANISIADNSGEEIREKRPGKEVNLYRTVYENTTTVPQQYTFATQKETKRAVNVELAKSFSKGETTNISIPTPDGIPSPGYGTSEQLTIEKKKGDTFEQTMTWSVNTEITVKQNTRITATLKISEETKITDFAVETTLKLLKDTDLSVSVHKRKNGEMVKIFSVADLETIFKSIQSTSGGIIDRFEEDPDDNGRSNVILLTHGTCKSVTYKDQHIKVIEEIIDPNLVE